jgi:hypothetical protein
MDTEWKVNLLQTNSTHRFLWEMLEILHWELTE